MSRAFDEDLRRRFGTRAVHAGIAPDPLAGAVMPPIYQTSTYVQDGLGRHKGYEYARTRNPTRETLERNVAALEGGRHGFAFGSGLAAVDAVLKLLSAGDHVVCGENVYGGTHRQMTHIWARLGLSFSFVDGGNAETVAGAVTPHTKIVYAETPTNPMMRLCDLAALGAIAKRADALFVVDNTFATPCFQRPLEFGADLVLHSTTKYLNGHSDMIGGMLVTARDDLAERLAFIQNGTAPSRGRSTAGWRCAASRPCRCACGAHDANGRRIAEWLEHAPRRAARVLPRSSIAPAARARLPPDERLRRHAQPRRWVMRRERAASSERTRVFALAESLGRRREPHRTSGIDDARAASRPNCARRWGSPTAWCGCRWESRTSRT